jgi:hypothetical protein
MIGSLLLLAASSLPAPVPSKPSDYHPTSTASAHATARIMIISGVKFGQDYTAVPASALHRAARLTDYDGQVRAAELLEFQ